MVTVEVVLVVVMVVVILDAVRIVVGFSLKHLYGGTVSYFFIINNLGAIRTLV